MSQQELEAVIAGIFARLQAEHAEVEKPKTFLGTSAAGWSSWAFKLCIAFAVGAFSWWQFVNKAIEERPTFQQVEAMARDVEADHVGLPMHHGAVDAFEQHRLQLKKLTELQIGQNAIMQGQADSLGEIKMDIREIRRRK